MKSTVHERRHAIPEKSNVYKTPGRDIPSCLQEAVSLKNLHFGQCKYDNCINPPLLFGKRTPEPTVVSVFIS
jgi:hypothetical protein